MAAIDLSSGKTILSTGLLQLKDGVAMSTTLTAVTDQSNTESQLLLATNLTQIAGTLQIHTDTATYVDAEDGSGNNRFTISRQPSSQQVSVDFASVPTDLTTVVGAIRTATNGSTLANVMSFLENGKIGLGTDTPTARLQINGSGNTSATTSLLVKNTGTFEILKVQDDGTVSIGGNGQTTFPLYVYGNSGLQIKVGNSFIYLGAGRTIRAESGYTGPMKFEAFNSVTAVDNSNYVFFRNQNIENAGTNGDWTGISIESSMSSQSDSKSTQLSITPTFTLNANTTSAQIQRGIYYNPIITNLRTAKHYGLQTTSGGAYINTTTPDASAGLQLDSTTQGLLFPRMTTVQKNAIVSPTAGLVVYDTNLNKLCVRTAAAWETITSI
jgi:hypothetical protein